jgi:hypothetical protein
MRASCLHCTRSRACNRVIKSGVGSAGLRAGVGCTAPVAVIRDILVSKTKEDDEGRAEIAVKATD